MANKFYPLGAQKMLRAQIDFDAHVIKAALVSSGYTFSDTHEFLSDTTGTVIGTPITPAGIGVSENTAISAAKTAIRARSAPDAAAGRAMGLLGSRLAERCSGEQRSG